MADDFERELNEAFDGSSEQEAVEEVEEVVEEPVVETKVVEEEDNIARTKMGRKLKALEENVVTKADLAEFQRNTIELLLKEMNKGHVTQSEVQDELADLADDDIITVATARKMFKKIMEEEAPKAVARVKDSESTAQKQYNEAFWRSAGSVQASEEYDDIEEELKALLLDPKDATFRVSYSNMKDPEGDAVRNIEKAARMIYKARLKGEKEPKSRFEGKTPAAPLGGAGKGGSASKGSSSKIDLDDMTKEYMKSTGMSEEEVRKLLG